MKSSIDKLQKDVPQESPGLFRALFEQAPIGIGIADMEGNFIEFNDARLKPGEYTREDILKIKNVANLYFDPEEREKALEIASKQGFLDNFEVRFKRKDGTPYYTRMSLTRITFKGNPCWQAVVEDITEQKQAEEEIKRLALAVSNVADGVCISAIDGNIQYVNAAVENMLEYLPGELVGMHVSKLYPGGADNPALQKIMESLGSDRGWTGEVNLQKKEGGTISTLESATPMYGDDGRTIGYVCTSTDITDMKRTEQDLRLRKFELEQLATIAHILAGEGNFEEKTSQVLQMLVQVTQSYSATLRLADESGQELSLVSAEASRPKEHRPLPALSISETLAGTVFQMGESLVIGDYERYPGALRHFIDKGFRSVVILPIKVIGETKGVVTVSSEQVNHFTPGQVTLLKAIVYEIGTPLENAELLESLKHRTRESEAVSSIAQILAQPIDFVEKVELVMNELARATEADWAHLRVADDGGQTLRLVA